MNRIESIIEEKNLAIKIRLSFLFAILGFFIALISLLITFYILSHYNHYPYLYRDSIRIVFYINMLISIPIGGILFIASGCLSLSILYIEEERIKKHVYTKYSIICIFILIINIMLTLFSLSQYYNAYYQL